MAIKMDYGALTSSASTLANRAAEMSALASGIQADVNNALGAWEGASRDRFASDFESVYPTLSQKVPELLQLLSENMKTMAENIYQADQANA